PRYPTAILSLFLIGAGMAALQVAINPLLRAAGGEEHYAFNSVLAQLIFGGASFLSPYIYTYFVNNIGRAGGEAKPLVGLMTRLVPRALPWVAVYWVFAALVVVMIIVLAAVRFPVVVRKEDERAGAWATHKALFKNPTVILFFLGIFAYVGTEQGIANWTSQFLATYHGLAPETAGAGAVSFFWGLMTIGGILGLVLLKFFDSRKVLVGFTVAAILMLSISLFGPALLVSFAVKIPIIGRIVIDLYPLSLLGFCASVMWPVIFSLALNSVASHHGSFSGILCTGIVGGALVPLLIGWLGDTFGLRQGMFVLYLTLGYILSIGIWAKPLIANETVAMKKKRDAAA
ncbi:MAG TPA: MFS transporter, partial [Acidobacteriota bacterium]|nr:MFS transporter [Acidobacteriota bacterium]